MDNFEIKKISKEERENIARMDGIGRNTFAQKTARNLENIEKTIRTTKNGIAYFSHKEAEKVDTSNCPTMAELNEIIEISTSRAVKIGFSKTVKEIKKSLSEITKINIEHTKECPNCRALVLEKVIEAGKVTNYETAQNRSLEKESRQDLVDE